MIEKPRRIIFSKACKKISGPGSQYKDCVYAYKYNELAEAIAMADKVS